MTDYTRWKGTEPIGEQVVLELIQDDSQIIVPGAAVGSDRLRVLAVGPGRLVDGQRIPTQCRPGDIVLLNGALGVFSLEEGDEEKFGIIPEHRLSLILDKSGRVDFEEDEDA